MTTRYYKDQPLILSREHEFNLPVVFIRYTGNGKAQVWAAGRKRMVLVDKLTREIAQRAGGL